jgi:hypothetical protein
MSIPKAPNQRYTNSRQLIAGSDMNNLNDQLNSYQLLTAAGTTQATAAKVDAANVEVASGSANNAGIILPVAYPGAEVDILNNSLNTTLVYPNGSTDVIQNAGTTYAAAKASVSMATLVSWRLKCIKAGFWQRVITS